MASEEKACTASVWTRTSGSRAPHRRSDPAMSWITPVSLLRTSPRRLRCLRRWPSMQPRRYPRGPRASTPTTLTGDAETVQEVGGLENRLVLGGDRHHTTPRVCCCTPGSLEGQIVRLGAPRGEDDLQGPGADGGGDPLPRLLQGVLGAPRDPVDPRGVAEVDRRRRAASPPRPRDASGSWRRGRDRSCRLNCRRMRRLSRFTT